MNVASLFNKEIAEYIDKTGFTVFNDIEVSFVDRTDNGVWGSCQYFKTSDGAIVMTTKPKIMVNHGIHKFAPDIVRSVVIPHEFAHAAQWVNESEPSHNYQFCSYARLFGGDIATKADVPALVESGFITEKDKNVISLLTGKQEKYLVRRRNGEVFVTTKNYWTRQIRTYGAAVMDKAFTVIGSNRDPKSVQDYFTAPD